MDEYREPGRVIKISQHNYGMYYTRLVKTIEKALEQPQGPRILAVWDAWMEKLQLVTTRSFETVSQVPLS